MIKRIRGYPGHLTSDGQRLKIHPAYCNFLAAESLESR
jgi:hypothetical protein